MKHDERLLARTRVRVIAPHNSDLSACPANDHPAAITPRRATRSTDTGQNGARDHPTTLTPECAVENRLKKKNWVRGARRNKSPCLTRRYVADAMKRIKENDSRKQTNRFFYDRTYRTSLIFKSHLWRRGYIGYKRIEPKRSENIYETKKLKNKD